MDIDTFLTTYEVQVRLVFFFGVFAVMATWEVRAPRRALRVCKLVRCGNNLALVFLNNTPRQVAWLPGMLVLPLIGRMSSYAINRRNWDAGRESQDR